MSRIGGRARAALLSLGVSIVLAAAGLTIVVIGPKASADPVSEWPVTMQCSPQPSNGWPQWTAKAEAIVSQASDGSMRIVRVENFRYEDAETDTIGVADFQVSGPYTIAERLQESGGQGVQWDAYVTLQGIVFRDLRGCTAYLRL